MIYWTNSWVKLFGNCSSNSVKSVIFSSANLLLSISTSPNVFGIWDLSKKRLFCNSKKLNLCNFCSTQSPTPALFILSLTPSALPFLLLWYRKYFLFKGSLSSCNCSFIIFLKLELYLVFNYFARSAWKWKTEGFFFSMISSSSLNIVSIII